MGFSLETYFRLTEVHVAADLIAPNEALLGAEPSDARAQNAAQRLRDALRPALRAGTYAATESGDPRTSRLVVTALPLRYTWHAAREIELDLLAEAGRYSSDLGNTRLLSLGAAARAPLGRHVRMSALALFNDFEEADSEVTGELVARYNPTDAVELRLGAERERLLVSRLSAVGETLDGVLYGPALGESVHAGRSRIAGATTMKPITGRALLRSGIKPQP